MMLLTIARKWFTDKSTISDFLINGVWECYFLEDKDRKLEEGGQKIDKVTAIPRGKYRVTIDWSDRFKCLMFHILNVPQFSGIRIHAGNIPVNTDGCPLPGQTRSVDFVGHSVNALKEICNKVVPAMLTGEHVWLEVI